MLIKKKSSKKKRVTILHQKNIYVGLILIC